MVAVVIARDGLTSAEAAARRRRDGPNELPPPKRPSAVRRFVDGLVHFFALMLWVAGALALVADMPELGIAIFAVIVLNAVFAFVQESRADHAAERLRSMLPAQVTVHRDGVAVQIDATEVVVGDLLLLEAGDRIPADATARTAHGLLVDTSLLTGESEPTPIDTGEPLHAGCFVVEGEASAEVTAIGQGTRLAAIAQLTTASTKPATPLTIELGRLVRTVAAIAVGVGGVFFLITVALGEDLANGFVFAIGVIVALVPEAMLPTVTLSLAWGAEQMAKRQVLVRELEAVETLGSTTFICTDKTGTLTRNQMAVVEVWTPLGTATIEGVGYEPAAVVSVRPDGKADAEGLRDHLLALALAGERCSNGYAHQREGVWQAHGDPMEAAIDVFARRLGADTDGDRATITIDARFPFDPRRRRMSIVTGGQVLAKGATDALLPVCRDGVHGAAQDAAEAFAARGLRVIAVATRAVDDVPPSAADAEADLRLLGLVALQDPPRTDVGDAIAACRRAGIRIAMITGDHPATARAIADAVGLRSGDTAVLVGAELPEEDAALGEVLDVDGVVVARVSPEDKLRIARTLRARGHVVAMTGDGVNDGPALHEADIGIAMGASGTDVAREAADLVLLDDHFASIVAGIEQGRSTFINIRRFLTYHLTDNLAELAPFVVWALSGGHVPLALGVLQILAIDLGTDTLTATALGAEPPSHRLLLGPPVRGRLLNRTVLRRAFGVLGPTVTVMSMLTFLVSFLASGWRPGEAFPEGAPLLAASGATFAAVVLGQAANAFACRSTTQWPGRLGWTTNRLLLPAIAFAVVFAGVVLYVPPVADALDQAGPSWAGWCTAALAPVAMLVVDAVDKRRHGPSVTGASRGSGAH